MELVTSFLRGRLLARGKQNIQKNAPPSLSQKNKHPKRVVPIKPLFACCHLLSMCAPSGGSRTAWRPEHLGRRSKVLCDRGRISDHPKVSNSSGGHAFRRYARASCAQRPLKDDLCARRGAHFHIKAALTNPSNTYLYTLHRVCTLSARNRCTRSSK